MMEPRRLVEDTESSLEQTLLRAGTSYRSPATTRARTLLALGLAGSATFTAGGATASVLAKSVWTKVLAISALGAVTAIPIAREAWDDDPPAPSVATANVRAAAPARPAAAPTLHVEPTLPAAPAVPAEAAAATAPETAPSAPARGTRPSRAAAARPPQSAALTEELAALDGARAALAAGDTRRAFAMLDNYTRTYPRGRLRVEADVLRIDALAKSGQRDAARQRAEAFLRRNPNSVLASRVRSYL